MDKGRVRRKLLSFLEDKGKTAPEAVASALNFINRHDLYTTKEENWEVLKAADGGVEVDLYSDPQGACVSVYYNKKGHGIVYLIDYENRNT